MPLTESDSWTMLEMSASDSCVVFAIRLPLVPDPASQHREDRDQREREERELPAQEEHGDHRRDDCRHARRDAGGGVGDDVLHAADVVVDSRLHLAGARPGEEREGESLQVAEDLGAQVVHDPLPDLVGEERLNHAEDSGDDRDHDHPRRVQGDRVRVVCLERHEERRSRNAGTTPRPALRTIRPSKPESRRQYGRKSGQIRRMFARRTSGSVGRSGVASPRSWKNIPMKRIERY